MLDLIKEHNNKQQALKPFWMLGNKTHLIMDYYSLLENELKCFEMNFKIQLMLEGSEISKNTDNILKIQELKTALNSF